MPLQVSVLRNKLGTKDEIIEKHNKELINYKKE
jgi:hypothetical protein